MGENNVATLQAMFGDEWDEASLTSILESCGGDAESAVDLILAAGSCAAWKAQQQSPAVHRTPQASHTNSRGETVNVVVPPGARPGGPLRVEHGGRTFQVNIPPHLNEGDTFSAAIPGPVAAGRGRRVVLPPDFLRLPGSSSEGMTDEQLAMMLQQEAFMSSEAAPSQRRRQPQPQQQQTSSQSTQSMSSMFSSVGNSMRAGLASAATSMKTMTNKIQQSATGTKPQQEPEGYGRVDLHDELLDESPLHLGDHPAAAAPAPASGGGNTTFQARDDDEDNTSNTIAL